MESYFKRRKNNSYTRLILEWENFLIRLMGKKLHLSFRERIRWKVHRFIDYILQMLIFRISILIEKGLIDNYDWTRDSKTIIYSFYDRMNENYDLWKTHVDGTDKIRLTDTPESENHPKCSRKDDLISYSVNNNVYISTTDKFGA